jgi:hypothetical protein
MSQNSENEEPYYMASAGLPEVADQESRAFGEDEAARGMAESRPSELPPDREDGPLGLEEYGVSRQERERKEPLSARLARELPDVSPDQVQPDPRLAQDLDQDAPVAELDGDREYSSLSKPSTGRSRPDPAGRLADDTRLLTEDEPIDPRLDSQVSMYDRPIAGIGGDAPVGELTRPGGGGYRSREPDEIADDEGPALGGLGNEELAMHEMPSEQADLEEAQSTAEPYVQLNEEAELDGPSPEESHVVVVRTGAEQPWEPEDLAVAKGADPTPENVERARQELDEMGPAAVEKTVP